MIPIILLFFNKITEINLESEFKHLIFIENDGISVESWTDLPIS